MYRVQYLEDAILADSRMQVYRRFQSVVDRVVRCEVYCRESIFIEDVIHAERSVDSSVMGEIPHEIVCKVVHQYLICCR